MIFQKISIKNIIAILILVALWALTGFLANKFLSIQISYIVSVILTALFLSYSVYMIRKIGVATIFFVIGALLTLRLDNLGLIGTNKFFGFLIAGIIFDFILIVLKTKKQNKTRDVIISTIITITISPIITIALLAKIEMIRIVPILNLTLLSLLLAIIGCLMSLLIWDYFRTTKTSLRFELD